MQLLPAQSRALVALDRAPLHEPPPLGRVVAIEAAMTCPNCGAVLIQTSEWLDEISGETILTLRCDGCGQLRVERTTESAEQGSLFPDPQEIR